MQAQIIHTDHLRFCSARYEDGVIEPGTLPSLYFINPEGRFCRLRPWHENGFALINSNQRNIYLLDSERYETLKSIESDDASEETRNRIAYLESTCAGDRYAPGSDVSGKVGRRIVDHRPGHSVHRGHQLITVQTAREVYEGLGINLGAFISYVALNPGILTGTESDEVIARIRAVLA